MDDGDEARARSESVNSLSPALPAGAAATPPPPRRAGSGAAATTGEDDAADDTRAAAVRALEHTELLDAGYNPAE